MTDTFRIENGMGFIGHRPIENAEVFVTDAVIPDFTFHTRNIRCKFNNGYELSIVFGDATYSENSQNQSLRPSSLVKYKGVDYHSYAGSFRARIQKNGKQYHLGLFATAELAYAAYCDAAIELHEDFARLS